MSTHLTSAKQTIDIKFFQTNQVVYLLNKPEFKQSREDPEAVEFYQVNTLYLATKMGWENLL